MARGAGLVRRRALQLLVLRPSASRGTRRRRIQCRLLGVPLRRATPPGRRGCHEHGVRLPARVHRGRPDRYRRSDAAIEERCARLFRNQPYRSVVQAAERPAAAAVPAGVLMRMLLSFAVLATFFAVPARAVTLVDRIVAVVNKEVITYSELYTAVGQAERELRRRGTPAPDRPVLERQMLERLIIDKAQLQMARESGIRVDELQVDRAVERIAASNNMTLAQFRRTLESDGVAFDAWRNDIRQQMIMGRLREREVENRVQVSESEVDVFLEQQKSRPVNAEYNIAHILVRVPEGASPERILQARERADKALGEIKGGAPFGRVAASYSDASDA